MAALPVKRLGRPISIHDEGHVAHHRSRSAASTTRSDLVARGSVRTAWQNGIETNTLTTARPRAWINDLPILPAHFVRQLLGLNPFKTSYFSLYRSIDTLKYRLILAAAVICAIAAGIPLPIIGVIFGKIIDSFPPEEEQLLTRLYQLIGVACAYFILTYIWSCCWGVVGEKVSLGLREQLVHKVIGMDQAYFDVNAPDMTQNLTGETQAIQMGTSEKVGLFIQSISYFVAAFVVGFILNATLTGILFAAVIPPMFIVVSTGTTLVSKLSRKANETLEKATNVAEGAISAVQIVQAFGCADVLTQRHLELLRNAARTGFKKGLAGAIMLGSIYFIAYSANALAFWKGSKLVESGGAGTVYAVVLLILDASFVIGQFGPFVQSLALAASAGGRLLEIIDKERPVIDVYNEEGELLDQARPGDIEFHGVTFVYPARPTSRVLDAVNLKIEQGSTTAIVGTSGSGKSSAVGLILRLYDPTSGKVTIGGQDLKDLKLAQLRSCMSLVDQDPVVFSGTVMDNISMGIQDESLSNQEVMQRCVQAATDANADFIARLPQGMNTKIGGAGGTQLSGGQLQRLCLARAIVRNPAILILDEPTSALDTVSERLIMQSLKRISDSGCTIIIIAHSERDLHVSILTTGLATITSCSKIVLMEHGQVIEQGTHKSLLQNGGHYCALVEAQRLESNETNLDEDMTPDETNDVKNDIEKAVKAIVDDQEVATPKIQMGVYEIFRRAINLCTVYHYLIILGLVGSIVSGLLIVGESIIFGNLIQLLNEENATPGYRSRIDFFCLMFFVVALVALFSYSLSGSAFAVVSETLVTRTRDISLATILRQDTSWFAEPGRSRHSLQAAVSSDSGKLGGLSGVILGTIFSVTAAIVSGIILAHVVAWKIAIVLLSTVPVMLIAGFFRLRILAQFEQRQESVYSEAAALASEACGAIRTVAAFGRERGVMRQYRAAIDGPYRRSFRFILGGNLILAFSLAITYFVYALAYYWGARQVRSGNYNQREFFTVLPALLFSAQAAGQMFSLAPEVARARTAASNVFALHDERPTIMSQRGRQSSTISTDEKQQIVSESSLADTASSSPSPQEPVAHIMMKRVRFAYPLRRQTPALREVNLEVHRGQFVGIVGPSGAGKSSIILLLERFYDPTSGAVLLDGTDVRDLGVEDYRSRLALVPQEANLFPGSISFNIGLGARPGLPVSHGDIESVCKAVNLHDFIMSLPQGYNTECGNNGSQLSGGQRQRVAIARALIRKPDLLLLDEATAALDGHSERNVQDAVAAAQAQGTSCIVVAHRVKTVERADVIYVLNHGLVVEQGAHDELVAKGGLYRRMVLAQQMK